MVTCMVVNQILIIRIHKFFLKKKLKKTFSVLMLFKNTFNLFGEINSQLLASENSTKV